MKWYYSDQLKLYISLEPLKINNRIFEIAKKHNFDLEWDDFGHLIMLDFAEFKTIVKELGGTILSPPEYWQLYKEVCDAGCEEVKASLMSEHFTEILDRVYVDEHTYIDHCEVTGPYQYAGEEVDYEPVIGRPGWIDFDDIDITSGHPVRVHENDADKPQMKYWSPDLPNTEVKKTIAIRGYVTSVAMPSLDLGIPADTRQPKMMVRFCTAHKPQNFLSDEEYQAAILQERCLNSRGNERIEAGSVGDKPLNWSSFQEYVCSNISMYRDSMEKDCFITFVTGHKNPDTDTVISSLLEAYRRYLGNTDEEMVYLPLIQSENMPVEIRYILGDRIADSLLYSADMNLQNIIKTGKIRFIYTDQNYQKEYQKYVTAIIDHHQLNRELQSGTLEIPCEIEMCGSCTALIARKLVGSGYEFDSRMSRMTYSAMLMDTENRVAHKMTAFDEKIMDYFQKKSDVQFDDVLYQSIMNQLISIKDGGCLYQRDYKHYCGFGFSVLKVTNLLGTNGFEEWIKKVFEYAGRDNERNNDYFTLVKVVDYCTGGLEVNKERIYWIRNNEENPYLIEKVQELLYQIAQCCMPGAEVEMQKDYIQISNSGKQLSRKKIVPAIERLVEYCGQYTYIESLKKWVAKDFLKENDRVRSFQGNYKTDKNGRICRISFLEAKKLADFMGVKLLNLKEYWQVYHETIKTHNGALQASLTDSEFLEFIDTCCMQGKLIYNPDVKNDYLICGDSVYTGEILTANPGLISPAHIDTETGLPNHIFSAANYYDKSLWRYWSPMKEGEYVYIRTYIFLLQQPCLDAKARPEESFANVGIRPVRETNLKVDVVIDKKGSLLTVRYKSEYDNDYTVIYQEDYGKKSNQGL